MSTFFTTAVVASAAYVGTMLDNLFAFSTQLALTPRDKFRSLSGWQSAAIAGLVLAAAVVGAALTVVPLRLIGLLAVAPFWLGWRGWQSRLDPAPESHVRRAITPFAVTLALGGDNLAVWIPLFRANDAFHLTVVIIIFALWQCLFTVLAWALASHPRVRAFGARWSRQLLPWLYALLGVVILIECHTL